MTTAELRARVLAWIAADPDPRTGAELTALLAAAEAGEPAAAAELADRFRGPLRFGTAGLRGALGGGPNRMNRAVVIRAAAGLMSYLVSAPAAAGKAGPLVVIGHDARHGSAAFAADTVAVVAAAGGRAGYFPRPVPTPLLAFAVRHLGADAGVMVTASHNPPQDNGYKVYLGGRVVTGWGQGAQIVPPHDVEIATRIDGVGAAAGVPRVEAGGSPLGEEVVAAYVARAAGVVPDGGPRRLRIVLTPMHGVGGDLAVRVLAVAGFHDVHVVPAQAEPDPDFPTLTFPNPEEPGALDLALAEARRVGADLVIATDPDADRCAVAVPDPGSGGGWRTLTGDEVGALLGEQAARLVAGLGGRAPGAPGDAPRGTLACSIVSSRLLSRIAAAHGLGFRSTLTGFKWLARVPELVFGYEEALGYCVDPAAVRDKDGISAAVRVAALAAERLAAGSSLPAALDELALAHGVHLTAPVTIRVPSAATGAVLARLRGAPPADLGGVAVVDAVDLAEGYAGLPPTDGLLYSTAAGDRVVVRPSGTEPKLKCYLEVVEQVPPTRPGEDPRPALAAARTAAGRRLAALRADVAALTGPAGTAAAEDPGLVSRSDAAR